MFTFSAEMLQITCLFIEEKKKIGGLSALKLIKFPSLFFSQENLSTTEAVAGDQRKWGGQMKTKPGSRA